MEDAGATANYGDILPRASEVLENIRRRLSKAPEVYWADDSRGEELHGAVMQVFEKYSWHQFADANIAIEPISPEPVLEVLAEFLWANRHVGIEALGMLTETAMPDVRQKRSLFEYFPIKAPRSKRKT